MPNFFSKYPKINYDLISDGSSFELTDITRSVVINANKIQDENALYTYYEIEDGERPDVVSHKLYDDVQYYWTFFIINDFLRDGYMSSWPLSYRNFTKMIDREYGKYSAVSMIPVEDPELDLNGEGRLDMSCVPLNEKYLPYLKFVSYNGEYRSSIAKYDSSRHQLIVFDCHRLDNTGKRVEISRETFIENINIAYKIAWDDSVRIADSPTDNEETKKKRNEKLKAEWIDKIYTEIIKYDTIGYNERLRENISIEQYVTTKTLNVASPKYRWSDYRNAANEYYSPSGDLRSAYDILTDEAVVAPKYKSFYDYESELNDSKRVIQVIRPDFIADFADEYFNILNDVS
jgi:hypothetical protein